MKKHAVTITFVGLLLFAAFLRIYHIATIPLGMHIDEAGLGLNAWSAAYYGTDRYGHFMPVCPSNFYGEQSAFYTYFCALLVKIWGLNIYTLRMPGVIMGILTVLFGSLLMKEVWGNKGLFTGVLLLSISPYFIMNSRYALDCNAMLGSLTIALYFLIRLLKRCEKEPAKGYYVHFALVGILFGITLYTYIISAIVIAVFGICFGMYYLFFYKEDRGLRFRHLLCLASPMLIMVIPLLLVVCVNYLNLDPITTPFFSIPKLTVNRTQEVAFSLSDLPSKLRGLLHTLTSDGIYGSSDRYWTMYYWSVPFILLGGIFSLKEIFFSLRDRKINFSACMLFVAIAEVIMFLLCGQYNYHINGIFIALAYFCVSGILGTAAFLKRRPVKLGFSVLLACLYLGSFVGFTREYFGTKNTAAYQVYNGVNEALNLLSQEQKQRDIYIMDEVAEFYLLSNPMAPSEFTAACDELGYIKDYQNLHFYEPAVYDNSAIYVCNKASGRYQMLLDNGVIDEGCMYLETKYYCVFFEE